MFRRATGRRALREGAQLSGGDPRASYWFDAAVVSLDRGLELALESICESVDDAEDCRWWASEVRLPARDWEARVLFINEILIERRGAGWGRRFVRALERWAVGRGAVGVVLHAGPLWGEAPSAPFWRAIGYTEVAEYEDDDTEEGTHVLMWRGLR